MLDISQYGAIYPVSHDLQNIRSVVFTGIEYNQHSLLNTANGRLVPIDFYGLFYDERNNLFLGLTHVHQTYNYVLTYNDAEYCINAVMYDETKRFLEWNAGDTNGVFQFMDSKPAYMYDQTRCDASRKGPVVFLRDGQEPIGMATNSLRPMSISDLETSIPILSVEGVGHIFYYKYLAGENASNEDYETNESDLPKAARSVFPLLKLLVEWESMTYEPWNSDEQIAVAARDFLQRLGMPDEIREDINSSHGSMHVYRYLQGEIDARRQPPVEQLSNLSNKTKLWLQSKMFYKNVGHMYRSMFPRGR